MTSLSWQSSVDDVVLTSRDQIELVVSRADLAPCLAMRAGVQLLCLHQAARQSQGDRGRERRLCVV